MCFNKSRLLDWLHRPLRLSIKVVLGATTLGICLMAAFSAFLVHTISHAYSGNNIEGVSAVIYLVGYFSVVAIVGCSIWLCLRAAFEENGSKQRLLAIIVSYVSVTITFTAIYFTMSVQADAEDAAAKYYYYRPYALNPGDYDKILTMRDYRALNNMPDRLWSGPDWPDQIGFVIATPQMHDSAPLSPQQLINNALPPLGTAVHFLPDEVIPVLADSLHFSIDTIATVGYGDITPGNPPARLASDAEVVCGIILLVVALQLALAAKAKE